MNKYFTFDRLSVGYQGKPLIRDICFDIQKGEIVTLIGPNGAGKSTILKSITRQLERISGGVILDGTDIQAMSYKALASRMAVVLTDRIKAELMTCHDIVASGRYPYTGKLGILTSDDEQKVEEAFGEKFGGAYHASLLRMDADTTSKKGAHERLLGEFASAGAAVLLGTQMIAKGLDFDDVTVVGVINADTQLHLPDYRAAERTFALVEQVAGRAGRAELAGRVFVQTYEADNVAIRAAASYDRDLFLGAELPKRRMLGYPPFMRMANVLVWGSDEQAVRTTAVRIQEDLQVQVRDHVTDSSSWSVLSAAPCVLAKLRGTYRWHVVVKCPPQADLSSALLPYFRARKPERGVNVAVDVDPVDLL